MRNVGRVLLCVALISDIAFACFAERHRQLVHARQLGGSLLREGIAQTSRKLELHPSSDALAAYYYDQRVLKTVTTDSEGNFDFGEVLPGKYAILEISVISGRGEEPIFIHLAEPSTGARDERLTAHRTVTGCLVVALQSPSQ